MVALKQDGEKVTGTLEERLALLPHVVALTDALAHADGRTVVEAVNAAHALTLRRCHTHFTMNAVTPASAQ